MGMSLLELSDSNILMKKESFIGLKNNLLDYSTEDLCAPPGSALRRRTLSTAGQDFDENILEPGQGDMFAKKGKDRNRYRNQNQFSGESQ